MQTRKGAFSLVPLLVLGLAMLIPTSLSAQYEEAVEIFGGYSYSRFSTPSPLNNISLNGYNASLTVYFLEWVGAEVSFPGLFKNNINVTDELGPNIDTIEGEVDVNHFGFLAGPTLRFVRTEKVAVSGKGQIGVSRGKLDPDPVFVNGVPLPNAETITKFAAFAGGAVDFHVTPKVSIRIQPGIYWTRFPELISRDKDTQTSFQVSAGAAFRF